MNSDNNITITRGDTQIIEIELEDGEKFKAGDIIRLTVRRSSNSNRKLIFKEKIVKEETGTETIKFEENDTSGLDFDKYEFDVELRRGNDLVNTIVKPAVFEVTEECTYDY